MSATIDVMLYCDAEDCREAFYGGHNTIEDARILATQRGWTSRRESEWQGARYVFVDFCVRHGQATP